MADAANPFDRFDPSINPLSTETPAPSRPANPFDQFGGDVDPGTSGRFGSFTRVAAASVAPTAAGLYAAGPGMEAGAAIGAFGGPVGGLVGGLVGGAAGFIGGSMAASAGQDYALSKAPDSWKEAIGQDDRQKLLDAQQHPYASFLGGLLPAALTMSPTAALRNLPENATALQRLMANPVTARVFGGAAMGGMELGQEKIEGQPVDWAKVAMATGFGMVFNRPNRIGEAITEFGAQPVRNAFGEPVRTATPPPTVAEAGDLGVMGPGATEETFHGQEEQEPAAKQAAQNFASVEQDTIGPVPQRDVTTVARQMEPDLFARHDELSAQADTLRKAIEDYRAPSEETFQAAHDRQAALEEELRSHLEDRNGYAGGPEARRLRAQIRDAQGQVNELTERQKAFSEGQGEDSPEIAAIRQKLMAVDFEMRDTGREVAAAYRRASDHLASGAVEPEPIPEHPAAAPLAALAEPKIDETGAVMPRTPEEQRAYIINDTMQKLVAAGRPPDEAEASARLIAARYETRAAQFGGKLGSAEDLYNVESAHIRSAEAPTPQVPRPAGTRAVAKSAPAKIDPAEARAAADRIGASKLVDQLIGSATDKEISDVLGGKLNEAQIAALREAAGTARVTELTQKTTPPVPEGEMTRQALAEYLRNGGTVSGAGRNLFQGARGKISIRPGEKPVITLMRDANASTFMHETGHDWLEQLLRDAKHEAAPEALKADEQTVREWLKSAPEAPITTKQHEKFARGFEQYLRLGIAPSKELAGVFAKFRNWLLKIYQTIKGLGQPISDDIRSVFDRMLTTAPERTIIAPENPYGPSLADIHERDVTRVDPKHAEAARDRIANEADLQAQVLPVKVQDEIAVETEAATGAAATEPGAEAAGGSGEPQEVAGPGGKSEPVSGNHGGGQGAEPVLRGGGAAQPDSDGLSGSAGAQGRVGNGNSQPLAPGPAKLLGSRSEESRTVDKAGNIRVENLTSVKNIADAIHDSADRNDDFKSVRGSMTKGQMSDLADEMGLDPTKLSEDRLGQMLGGTANLGPKILAARRLVVDSATLVSGLMKKAAESGSDADAGALTVAIARHDMIQSALAGVTAEWGRAGNAFHSLLSGWESAQDLNQFLKDNTGRTLFQMKEIAKLGSVLDTPGQISKFTRDSGKYSFGRMILEYWINGLISGPSTHFTYMIGNSILTLVQHGLEAPVAAGIGAARQAFGREGNVVYLGEMGAAARAAARGAAPALKASVESFRAGAQMRLPGQDLKKGTLPGQPDMQFAQGPAFDENATFHDVAASVFGLFRGMMDGVISGGALLKAGGVEGSSLLGARYSPLGVIPDITVRGVGVLPLGTAARLPGRFIAAIHALFASTNYSIEKGRGAYRIAANEGLSGDAFDARIGQIRQNPTEEQMKAWSQDSLETTLMGQGGAFTKKLSELINTPVKLPGLGETPVLKFIDPFVHISSNIINQTILQRTPVGIFSREIRADLMGANGTERQDLTQARMLVGSALAMTFGGLAAQGYVSGSGPSDPKQAAMWRLAGNQAHSVRIGDTWYDVHRLGPMGMLLGISADLYDMAAHVEKGEMSTAASSLMHAVTQNVLDESFMRGPAELIQAIESPQLYGNKYIDNFLAGFLPYSVGMAQMARAADPYSRLTRGLVDTLRNKIPGFEWPLSSMIGSSTDNFPRRDIWGEPMANPAAAIHAGVTAVYERQMSHDPVNQAMLNLGFGPSQVQRTIRNVKLSDQQYDDFSRIAGRMTKMRLDTIVNAPDWQQMTATARHYVIVEAFKQCRNSARELMMMKYPSIAAQATQAKKAKFAVPDEAGVQ